MLQATRRDTAATPALPTVNASRLWPVLAWLLVLLAAVFLAAGVWRTVARLQAQTQVIAVQVDGDLRNDSRQLIAEKIKPIVRGNYFSVDLLAIQKTAQSAPWVEDVVVSRRWPNAVHVQVREKQPVALWGAGGLVSARGELFIPHTPVNTTDLPILFGPDNKGIYVMQQYRAMNSILRGIDMRIVELQLTERMSWFLRLDNGIHLVIDQADTIEKLQRFAYLYARQLKPDAENILSVDLRYRNGVAVAWRSMNLQR